MQILRSLAEGQIIVPTDKIVGATTFQKKDSGGLHIGHEYLLNQIKNNCEISVVSFYDTRYLMNQLYPTGNQVVPITWDENYCTTWAENNGVDYVFIPSNDFLIDLTGVVNFETIKTQTDNIISNEGYAELIPGQYMGDIKFIISTLLISNEVGGFFHKNYHYCGWEQVPIPFVRRDVSQKYSFSEVIMIDPLRRPDGLVYSTRLLNLDQSKIDIFVSVNNAIQSLFLDSTSNADISMIDITPLLQGQFELKNFSSLRHEITGNRDYVTWNLFDPNTNLNYNFGELF
jgi:pantothenate synthetase